MHKLIIEGQVCVLGEMLEAYLPAQTGYLNDPEVNRFILSRPPFTIDQQYEWLSGKKARGDQIFAVLAKADALNIENHKSYCFAGVMEFRDINFQERSACSASLIGRQFWRKGIAREARLMQLKLAFERIGLERVYSTTVRANIRSRRLLTSTGYQLIKILPKARMIENIAYDELLYCVSHRLWLPYWIQHCQKNG